MEIRLTVKGMHCKSCKMLIEEELEDMGAQDIRVTVDEAKQIGAVSCTHDNKDAVISAIMSLGEYDVS